MGHTVRKTLLHIKEVAQKTQSISHHKSSASFVQVLEGFLQNLQSLNILSEVQILHSFKTCFQFTYWRLFVQLKCLLQ